MKVLAKVNYTEQERNKFPSIFPDAYNIRSVIVNVKDVFLSRALVDEMRKHERASFFTQQVTDDVLSMQDVSDNLQRLYEVHYEGLSLRLKGSNTGRAFYLADVCFNGRSIKNPTNMRSAYLFLDSELIQLNDSSNHKKLASY